MSVAATADISITGDAYVAFGSQDAGFEGANANFDDQRVRIKVVGSADDTKVVAVIRNGSATRADKTFTRHQDVSTMTNAETTSSNVASLYLTTRIGNVDVKAGDFWGTIGLGAHSMQAAKKNAASISTKHLKRSQALVVLIKNLLNLILLVICMLILLNYEQSKLGNICLLLLIE